MGLVSEHGCRVGDQVVGMLQCFRLVKGHWVPSLKPPEQFIVRRLFKEGGAVVARLADPHRGWWIDVGYAQIFRPEHPPDIFIGAEFFANFAVKEE